MISISIFAISDLHLSTNTDKSMEIFGKTWDNYMEKIRLNWQSNICDDDTVLIGGDISWEMKLKDCKSDFEFLNSLKGKKIIIRGNHDYWWDTVTKMNSFAVENGFSNISFISNNAYDAGDFAICGTRWWIDKSEKGFKSDDEKIYNHEIERLNSSLEAGKKIGKPIIVMLHYPPFDAFGNVNNDILTFFEEYDVVDCIYGHLHAKSLKTAKTGAFNGTNYYLTSADYLEFSPIVIKL